MTAATLKEAVTGKPTPPAEREPTPYERFRAYVQTVSFLNEIALLVGGEAQAKTFVRVVLTAVQQTPRLLEADRRSLLLACMKAARDRLMPDGKEAVFNIYNTKVREKNGREVWVPTVQYLPMSGGIIKKMYESGHVKFVDALAVYAKDEFIYERGDSPRLVHRPTLDNEPGEIVAAYAVIKLDNGETKREVMPRRDIEKVRAASQAPDGPGWRDWYDQFAIKSVIKRAYKQLPSSVEIEQVIAHDNEAMGFRAPTTMGGEFDAFPDPTTTTAPEEPRTAIEHNPGEKIPDVVGGAAPAKESETVAADTAPATTEKTTAAKETISLGMVASRINQAKNVEELNLALDLIREIPNKVEQRQLNLMAAERRRELEAKSE